MPLLDHFGFLAPIYDRVISPPSDDTIARMAKLPIDGLLLDAGGGTGRIASRLTDLTGGIVLLDASLPMLRQAQTKGGLLPLTGATERLPFDDGEFERIIMVDVYHHVEHQRGSLKECWRVLRPGGVLVIEEPDIRLGVVKLVALAEKLALMRSHFQSGEEIAEALESLGGEVRVVRDRPNFWVVARKPGPA
jgi:demethylmenaquinone methyltransferase/2-methoxy-6-polyprenyl-1,4-benzoquinol methylase